MASNQDILAFLRSEKEAREKEKVQEAETRAKEREQDMTRIAEMIRVGVRDEVKAAVQPVEERLEVQEKACQGLGTQIQALVEELTSLKGEVQEIKDFNRLPSPEIVATGSSVARSIENNFKELSETMGEDNTSDKRQLIDICSKARRIIGFQPIEPRMLEIQKVSYGAKNTEEAILMEIKSYLKCEMKVRPHDIENLEIVRIFPPAKDNWNTLYVEFGSEQEVNKIYQHTRVMVKEDHKVVRWYPKELFERFQALDSFCYKMREEMRSKGAKLRTKVVVAKDDLELSTRLPNERWKIQALPSGLPKIDLNARSRSSLTSSPPPGRPTRRDEDKKRQLSGSDTELSNQKKKQIRQEDLLPEKDISQAEGSKQGENEREKELEQAMVLKDVVVQIPDPGQFIDQEAYCPLTPAKTKNIHDKPVSQDSPIFHSKGRHF